MSAIIPDECQKINKKSLSFLPPWLCCRLRRLSSPICTSIYMHAPALCRLLSRALSCESRAVHVTSFACSGSLFQMWMCCKCGHYRGFFIYAHCIGQHKCLSLAHEEGDPTKWGAGSDFGGAGSGSGLFWHKLSLALITSDVCFIWMQVPCEGDVTGYSTMISVRSEHICSI